jgi:hypothetical protein
LRELLSNNEVEIQFIAANVSDGGLAPDPETTVRTLRNEAYDAELTSIIQRTNDPAVPDPELSELHKRMQMLDEMKKQPLAILSAMSAPTG